MPSDRSQETSNPAQLQHDINSGRTGDKVAGFDPAAAPLGTDEEAGGSRNDPQVIHQARLTEREGKSSSGTRNAATPALQPDANLPHRPFMTPLLVGGAIAAVLVIAMIIIGPI